MSVSRIVDRLLESEVPLRRDRLHEAALAAAEEEAPLAGPEIVAAAVDALVGLGPIERLLRDATVSDVLVNGPEDVWVERAGRLMREPVKFADDSAVVAAVERVLAPLGLRIDRSSPTVDARLADGSRLHAVIPPVSVRGVVVAIRRFTRAVRSLDEMVEQGAMPVEVADRLRSAVHNRENIVVSGGTGAGKTTLLNVLAGEIEDGDRIVTIEDAAELALDGHVVSLEARPANAEGAGAVELRELVRSALRLRPDRIVVGEVRGPEALDMIAALNTGHAGSMSTVHANSPAEALWRLETLALSGSSRVGELAVRRQLRAAVDLVVQMTRAGGRRRVSHLATVDDDAVQVTTW